MDVEIRHLRAVTTLATTCSFTQAASQLHLSQPSLSRTLRQLENILSVRLVERSSHHVELTATGAEFVADAERVLTNLDHAITNTAGHRQLRLGFSWQLPDPWAHSTIKDFTTSTGAHVDLHHVDDPIASVSEAAIDLAVVRGITGPDGTTAHTLFTEERIAVVAADSLLADRPHLHVNELGGHTIAINTVSGSAVPEYWTTHHPHQSLVAYRDFDEWLEHIATTHTIGVAPHTVSERTHHAGIRYLPLHSAPPVQVLLIHRTHHISPLLRHFIEAAMHPNRPTPAAAFR